MIYLKKHITEDGIEYLDDQDHEYYELDKASWKKHYLVMQLVKYLNYFQFELPTSFGNPEHERQSGFLLGYLAAHDYHMENDENFTYVKTDKGKTIIKADKLNFTEAYKERKKSIQQTYQKLGI